MKIAFHFDAQLEGLKGNYAYHFEHEVARAILDVTTNVSSRVFVGDLLLRNLSCDVEQVAGSTTMRFNRERFRIVVESWLSAGREGWHHISDDFIVAIHKSEVFVICFESLEASNGSNIHQALTEVAGYLGAIQISDESAVHWQLYSHSLIPQYRIVGDRVYVFHEAADPDSKDDGLFTLIHEWGFRNVFYEDLNWKYTIFDEYHDFEHARRVAEWKRRGGSLLAFIADQTVSRLGDSAPKLGDRLWAALRALESAETEEQFAHVATSCRRIIEYVTDSIFPPTNETREGRKLGGPQFRNRLLAFADDQHRKDTSINLITVSTEALSQQLEGLSALANKGIHGDMSQAEARRCLLRTILLLDDIVSLRRDPFPVRHH